MDAPWSVVSSSTFRTAFSLALLSLLLISACADRNSDDPTPSRGGAGGQDTFATPKRLTEGTHVPSEAYNLPNVDVGEVEPMHVGEIVNGVRIAGPGVSAEAICKGQQSLSNDPLPFELTYLPENTFELHEPQVYKCPDGRIQGGTRDFTIGVSAAVFGVSFARLDGEPVASGTGPVRPIEISGSKGVLVEPQTHEGKAISQTQIVFITNGGSVAVNASAMPLEEVLRIAKGIECFDC